MSGRMKRWTAVAAMAALMALAGCKDKWFQIAAGLCGVGAAMCDSLAVAIPADGPQFKQAADDLRDAQKLLDTWESTSGGTVDKVEAELAAAETIVNGLSGLTPEQKTIVDVSITTIEEAISLVASNAKTTTLSAARARAAITGRGVTKEMSRDDLKKEFNRQAARVGAHPI